MKTNFLTTIGIALSTTCLIVSCDNSVNGTWSGSCHNTTFGGNARLEASFTSKGNIISGYLAINSNELGGSGAVQGVISGKTISFDTPGDNDMMTGIHWEGTISGKTITGTYVVAPTLQAQMLGAPVQNGTFRLNKN